MMKISKRKGKLNVTLEPECTIIDVEKDTDKIRSRALSFLFRKCQRR